MPVANISNPLGQHENGAVLLARAQNFRTVAAHVHPVLANAYLRRAAELWLEACLLAARSTPLDIDEILSAAAA